MQRLLATAVLLASLLVGSARAASAESGPSAEGAARARLDSVRQDPALANDPAAIEALARDAEGFPGTVRADARMVVAQAWLRRLHRPEEGLAELRKVAGDREADPIVARLAERQIVGAAIAAGRIDDAVAEAHAHADLLDARFVAEVDRLTTRRALRRVAGAVVMLFGALSAIALARAARLGKLAAAGRAAQGFAGLASAFVVFVGGAGGALASSYEMGNAAPFLWLGSIALPILILARSWAAVGSAARAARAFRALVCATAVLAAAFLVLDVLGASYLEGFGL
jgi:hypothetical protein